MRDANDERERDIRNTRDSARASGDATDSRVPAVPRVAPPHGRPADARERPVDLPIAHERVRSAASRVRAYNDRMDKPLGGTAEERVRDIPPAPELIGLLAQLRAAITMHVARLRAHDVPPEQVVIEVKRLVREAEGNHAWADGTEIIVAQVVRWSIDAYYDQPELRGAPLHL